MLANQNFRLRVGTWLISTSCTHCCNFRHLPLVFNRKSVTLIIREAQQQVRVRTTRCIASDITHNKMTWFDSTEKFQMVSFTQNSTAHNIVPSNNADYNCPRTPTVYSCNRSKTLDSLTRPAPPPIQAEPPVPSRKHPAHPSPAFPARGCSSPTPRPSPRRSRGPLARSATDRTSSPRAVETTTKSSTYSGCRKNDLPNATINPNTFNMRMTRITMLVHARCSLDSSPPNPRTRPSRGSCCASSSGYRSQSPPNPPTAIPQSPHASMSPPALPPAPPSIAPSAGHPKLDASPGSGISPSPASCGSRSGNRAVVAESSQSAPSKSVLPWASMALAPTHARTIAKGLTKTTSKAQRGTRVAKITGALAGASRENAACESLREATAEL
uniref:Uncharacterized protein n=1 Tax=Physcomitrium patens TaxID=3218 RepID=A0A2K1L3D7_PHYPA|nr:hypothetical protein PHYPA_003342 [Physcomitrium patens]